MKIFFGTVIVVVIILMWVAEEVISTQEAVKSIRKSRSQQAKR